MLKQGERRRSIAIVHSQPGTRRRWAVSITLRQLYPWEQDPVLIAHEAGCTLGFDTRTIQSVAGRYAVYAIPATSWENIILKIILKSVM
jgi:hypothetical protein